MAVFYLPSVLAHFVVLGLAGWMYGRNRGAAVALGVGTLLQLLASVASYGTTALTISAASEGWSMSEISTVSSAIGLVASLMRALGEIVVAGGVYLGVPTNSTGAASSDPYGYGRG